MRTMSLGMAEGKAIVAAGDPTVVLGALHGEVPGNEDDVVGHSGG